MAGEIFAPPPGGKLTSPALQGRVSSHSDHQGVRTPCFLVDGRHFIKLLIPRAELPVSYAPTEAQDPRAVLRMRQRLPHLMGFLNSGVSGHLLGSGFMKDFSGFSLAWGSQAEFQSGGQTMLMGTGAPGASERPYGLAV